MLQRCSTGPCKSLIRLLFAKFRPPAPSRIALPDSSSWNALDLIPAPERANCTHTLELMSDWSDIGNALRAEREALGSSLKDVSHRTRIPVQTLHELEENDYSSFPSRAYAKSFLAQYSQHLGVDADEWLDQFDTGNVLDNLDSYAYLNAMPRSSRRPALRRCRPGD